MYGPADATAFAKLRHLLPHLNPDWFYLSGTSLPRLSWKRGCSTGVAIVVVNSPVAAADLLGCVVYSGGGLCQRGWSTDGDRCGDCCVAVAKTSSSHSGLQLPTAADQLTVC